MFDQSEAEVGYRTVGSDDRVGKKADKFEDALAGQTVDFDNGVFEQKKHGSELADKQKYPEGDQ